MFSCKVLGDYCNVFYEMCYKLKNVFIYLLLVLFLIAVVINFTLCQLTANWSLYLQIYIF